MIYDICNLNWYRWYQTGQPAGDDRSIAWPAALYQATYLGFLIPIIIFISRGGTFQDQYFDEDIFFERADFNIPRKLDGMLHQ
jgi:hypothetical protein